MARKASTGRPLYDELATLAVPPEPAVTDLLLRTWRSKRKCPPALARSIARLSHRASALTHPFFWRATGLDFRTGRDMGLDWIATGVEPASQFVRIEYACLRFPRLRQLTFRECCVETVCVRRMFLIRKFAGSLYAGCL